MSTKESVDNIKKMIDLMRDERGRNLTMQTLDYEMKAFANVLYKSGYRKVIHSRWIGLEYPDKCENCGRSINEIMDADSSYSLGFDPCKELVACPFCGAIMDLDGNDDESEDSPQDNKVTYDICYNDIGQKVTVSTPDITFTVQLKYSNLEVVEFPESCSKCPVGFSQCSGKCGRNVPWTDEDYKRRPSTCKLKKISLPPFLESMEKETHE